MSKSLAIANPLSGQFQMSSFDQRWMGELRDMVDEVVVTDGAGAATDIAKTSNGYDDIVVVGGDGTIFEVIAGMDRTRQQLAVIPTGRGNCLARDLGIKRVADGFHVLKNGTSSVVDLDQIEVEFGDSSSATYLSASTIALGYVAAVVDRASKLRAAGRFAYALATVMTQPTTFSYRLGAVDGFIGEHSSTGIVINNTVHLANFPAFKDASLQDGLMDVLILSAGWVSQTVHNLSVLSRSRLYDPGERFQTSTVRLSLQSPQTLMIDGQLYPDVVSLTVNCVPNALRCRRTAKA